MNKEESRKFIKSILTDTELNDEDCDFLFNYLQQWLTDSSIDVTPKVVELLNKHSDKLDKLKKLYSKNKIMDVLERRITLSQIANGDITITDYKNTKEGVIPYDREPSFSERISAINTLNALDSLENIGMNDDRVIIIDDIRGD